MRSCVAAALGVIAIALVLQASILHAQLSAGSSLPPEDGSAAWLRYARLPHPSKYSSIPANITIFGSSPVLLSAGTELQRGLSSMLGRPFTLRTAFSAGNSEASPGQFLNAIVLAPQSAIRLSHPTCPPLATEAFCIVSSGPQRSRHITIIGGSPQAVLYGAFHLLEQVASEHTVPLRQVQAPAATIRWTDEWDNSDGTVERGYAGRSIFFAEGHVRHNLTRAAAYARLLSSIGINGCNVNNVNADLTILRPDRIRELAALAAAFRPWGVRLALSVDLSSPVTVGGLATFDPLNPAVIAWWTATVKQIYALIPDFAGFTVKADSEGQAGPARYGRSPVDAANMLARALGPYHGVVLYRGFVYNNHLDWHNLQNDRARAGVDNFARYDGQFAANVIIQIKEGPIDFQAREPVSPLFAALRHTNTAVEVEATQEYTGQQRHMVWLPGMWKWVLDTDLRAGGRSTPVKSIVSGKSFPLPGGVPRPGGFVSVANVGMEPNWLHHPMALANLYGFGKLAWNPDQPLTAIIDTWTRLTWGNNARLDATIDSMQLSSWRVYVGYTGPNGMGTLTNILGYHFGPGIESAERNGWGQWFRAGRHGIGMDRTAQGTGFIQQYPPQLAARYQSLATCPDDLLLFFHHVPYDFRLHNGKTLVQSIYDTHYASALASGLYVAQWTSLQPLVDPQRYQLVLGLFNFQAGHALVWRDAIDIWFANISGIPDARGRVGHDPNRIEAEAMQSSGYVHTAVTPWETASGGHAVLCNIPAGCSISTRIHRPAAPYDVAVQYFDTWIGASSYQLLVNGRTIAHWRGDDTLPPAQFDPNLDGQDSTRYTAHHVFLHPGDTLTVRGVPDLRPQLNTGAAVRAAPGALHPDAVTRPDYREFAPVDYIEIGPDGPITPQ